MPQIGAKGSPVELLEIIQMEPLGKFKNNHNGSAKGGGVKDGNSWRRSHTGNMSEQDVDDVAFLTGPDSQSSRLARERAAYGGSSSGTGRAVAVCSQKRALILSLTVLVVLLTVALVLAYAGPQAECGCAGEPPPGAKRGVGLPTPSPTPRLAVGGTSYPWGGARLPMSAEPIRYTLWLHPNLTTQEVKGEVIIEFHIEKETNFVVLNARDLNITDKMITGPKGNSLKIMRFLEYKPADQIYFEIKDKFRKRANYTLSLRYNTKLSKKPKGFFIADYFNADGEKKQLAATNFGLTHARSAFPCFDEPQLKAKFKITIVRDRFHVSLTNMPIAATEEAGFYLGHRLLQDDFQESPEMSTYLVGLVVCEFARSAALAPRGTSVSVYADKRHADAAHSILENAVNIIDRYENFLNVTFPLPKLDMVIMEGFEDTAEGWGLLGIGSSLLPDKKHLEKLLAHQWLGGLVTPKWWGSRWLTEGLVALLQHGPSESESPEDDTLLLEHTVPALRLDALPNAHPVSISVQDPEDIEAVQDELSYHKGAALVGMAWSAAGSGARIALRDFLSLYARSAADPRDLWRLLGRKARADLQVVMESWTEQAGYPLLTLSRNGDTVTVKQERFLLSAEVPQTNITTSISLLELSLEGLIDPSSDIEIGMNNTELRGILGDIHNVSESEKVTSTTPTPHKEPTPHKKDKSKYRYRWYVPLTYILGPVENVTNDNTTEASGSENVTTTTSPKSGGKNMKQSPLDAKVQNSTQKSDEHKGKKKHEYSGSINGTHLIWMNMTEVKFKVPAGVSWVKLNVGGRGLYRANYPEAEWKALKKALGNGALSSAGDRASILDDAFTLSRAGLLNASVALSLCEYMGTKPEAELAKAPWKAALMHLQRWTALLAGAAAGGPLKKHLAYRLVAPAARRVLSGKSGAVDGELVEAAVEFELPDAVAAAKKMFDDWVDNNVTVAVELRQAVYSAGVRHGAEEAWMKCWKAYKKSEDPSERVALLSAMASTPDHWLLNRYLQATLDSRLVAASDVRTVLAATARRQPGRLLAWRHLRARASPPPPELLEAVAEHMASPDDFKEVSEFYADIDVGPALNRSLETIALNVAWVGKNERDLIKYLSQNTKED